MSTTLDRIRESAADLESSDAKKRARAQEIKKRYEQGLFNPELVAEGAKPVPIQKPLDVQGIINQSQTAPGGMSMPTQPSYAKDMVSDTVDTAKKWGNDMYQRGKNIVDIAGKAGREQGIGSTALQLGGQVFGGIVDTAERAFEGAVRVALPPEFEKLATEEGKKLLQTEGGQVAVAAIQGGMEKWNQFKQENPELARNIEATVNIAEAFGVGALTKPVEAGGKAAVNVLKQTPEAIAKGQETLAKGFGAAGKVMDKVADARKVAREQELNDAIGRILQGKPEDIAAGKKVLGAIDTQGVKTYKDLNQRIEQNITDLSTIMDTELSQYTDKLTPDKLTKVTKVGDTDVTQSHVTDALDGLENAYKQSGDPVNATKVAQIRQKLETEGLTLLEINNLAKEYGREFGERAFDKMGNPKQGYNAESFEATRKGIKTVVRDRLPDDVAKELDSQISSLYDTQALTKKMEEKVNALYQKVKNRTLAQKAGGVVADVVDLLSMGTLRGFVQKLLPSNVGLKTANSLDLEKELAKNLKKIEKIASIEDEVSFEKALTDYVNEVQPGLSTRVTSGLSSAEKDDLLSKLMATDSKTPMMEVRDNIPREDLDIDAFARLEELKKTANRKSLTEREYVELRELLDAVSD